VHVRVRQPQHQIGKAAYQREAASLRAALLNAQYDLKLDGRFPVLILIAGVEGAGKGETVNLLNEWMDPRHIQHQRLRRAVRRRGRAPAALALLARAAAQGRIGIFFGAWHTQPIVQRVMGQIDDGDFAAPSTRSSTWSRCCATKACCC
jgi:polyphosphate kinase 2 (PPK2 family)